MAGQTEGQIEREQVKCVQNRSPFFLSDIRKDPYSSSVERHYCQWEVTREDACPAARTAVSSWYLFVQCGKWDPFAFYCIAISRFLSFTNL